MTATHTYTAESAAPHVAPRTLVLTLGVGVLVAMGAVLMAQNPWDIDRFVNGGTGFRYPFPPDPDECDWAHGRIQEIQYHLSQLTGRAGVERVRTALEEEKRLLEDVYGRCGEDGDH